MCWRSVSGNCLCRHGMFMFDRCFSSAASHLSTPPHSQDSAADVQQKSCIVSAPFVNLARPLQPIRHVKLNHCGILISLWEQQPQCCRGNGQWVVHCMTSLVSCYLAIWWFFFFLPLMWHPVFSGCRVHCVVGEQMPAGRNKSWVRLSFG